MKVLVVSYEFPPSGGGAGVVASQLAVGLSARDIEVEVLCRKGYIDNEDIKIICPPSWVGRFWFLAFNFLVTPQKYDLIILNDPGAAYYAGMFLKENELNRSIYLLHGSEPEYIYESPSFMYRLSAFKYFYRRSLDLCFKVLSPSQFMSKKFVFRCEAADLIPKIDVVYYGVDRNFFFDSSENACDRPRQVSVILSVARIVAKKGFFRMLDIFERAYSLNNNLTWLIVGDGDAKKKLEEEVVCRGLAKVVKFVGKVKREDLRKYYSSASVFFLLSEFEESFGLVYVEANLCGLAVISADNGGVVESVNEGVSGYICKNDMSVEKILTDEAWKDLKREKIIAHGCEFDAVYFLNYVEAHVTEQARRRYV